MRPSCFQTLFIVSALLILSFSHGSGRKIMVETFGNEASASVSLEQDAREMIQLDYADAGPNFNAKAGYLFTPPLPPSPPPPPPSAEELTD